jgi:hypothetical protein
MYAKNMDEDECHEWLEEVLATKAAPKKRTSKKAVAATA